MVVVGVTVGVRDGVEVTVRVAVGVAVLVAVVVAVRVGVGVAVIALVGSGVGVPEITPKRPERFKRPPVTVRPTIEEVALAFESIAERISAAVANGNAEAYSAIAPDTCGVAIEVPE